jgi:hypothetical protein
LNSNLRKLNFLSKFCRLPHHTDHKLATIAVLSAIGGLNQTNQAEIKRILQ